MEFKIPSIFYYYLLLITITTCYIYQTLAESHEEYLVNFTTKNSTVSQWIEHSDTLRPEGKSKSSFVLHKTGTKQYATLFTLLNPQPCGAAFAGIKNYVNLDLSSYKSISMKIRGQGQFTGYKFILRHYGQDSEKYPAFLNYFEAPKKEFEEVTLLLDDFKPYIEGKLAKDNSNLNKSAVSSVAILAYGGVYAHKKQSGVGALEIEWIKLV